MKRRPRVAWIAPRANRRGGIGRYSLEILERLADRFEIHLFATEFSQSSRTDITFHEVPVTPRPFRAYVRSFSRNASRMAAEGDFDLVHGQSTLSVRQDVVSCHTCYRALMESMYAHDGSRLRKWIRFANPLLHVEREQYRPGNHRKVIALSEGTKRDLIRWYGIPEDRLEVVYNGVDLETFHPRLRETEREPTRARLDLADGDLALLFLGYELERKGLGVAIEALARIDDPGVKLVVAGGDGTLERHRALARERRLAPRVRFLGPVTDPEEVRRLYVACDLFVFPSAYESCPLVTLEALASGLPVVGTRANGIPEQVTDGASGRLVERTPTAVADAIRGIREHPDPLPAMRSAARKDAERFPWDRTASRTGAIWEGLLG